MASHADVKTIVAGLQADEPQARKLAAFSLQGILTKDASFADTFAETGGLPILRRLILDDRGNTLAYALGSFTQLLQRGIGWGQVEKSIVSLAVELVVNRSVINVLRNALSLLVLVVTQAPADEPLDLTASMPPSSHSFDYASLKTLLKDHPTFLTCLSERLEAADHVLCTNVLRLINGLLRDSIENGGEDEWPVFYKQLQSLGVLVAVEQIMRGDAVIDLLDHLVDFQNLVKTLLQRWQTIPVQMDITLHRTALLAVQHSSFAPSPSPRRRPSSTLNRTLEAEEVASEDQTTWRRLGFTTEQPAHDFDDMNLLGLVDLAEYVRGSNDEFEKSLLEQSVQPVEERCPIARVSLCISRILYDHFRIDETNDATPQEDENKAALLDRVLHHVLQPSLLRWNAIHMSAVSLFIKLWNSAHALTTEFDKISALVHTLLTDTLHDTSRKDSISSVQSLLNDATLSKVRDMESRYLEASSLATWGNDLNELRTRLHDEATRFMQEQRIQCLLAGAWFPVVVGSVHIPRSQPITRDFAVPQEKPDTRTRVSTHSWRFVRLSAGRRHLHHSLYAAKPVVEPTLADMRNRIDVNNIKSVVSNVSVVDWSPGPEPNLDPETNHTQESTMTANGTAREGGGIKLTTLHIVGTPKRKDLASSASSAGGAAAPAPGCAETTLLELSTPTSIQASEWLDGLLMLLNQKPITADTDKMIRLIENWSLKAKVLNLDESDALARRGRCCVDGGVEVPSREGVGTDFYYAMG